MISPTLVLEIGAEGGRIRIFRDTAEPTPGSGFLATLLDQTPLLLDESDGGGSAIRRDSGWGSWEQAVAWIGRYPWPCLRALKVDPSVADDGKSSGSCPGYVIDHVVPLKRGGADSPSNMQWQTTAAAKAKDKTE